MNNELLTLFDIKDDIVESFTIDNIDTYYEINIRFKPSVVCCPHCGSIHFISKGTQKKRLVSTPINDQPVKIITHLKRYKCLDCTSYFSDTNPIAYENWSFTKVAIISILNKLKPYNATYASNKKSLEYRLLKHRYKLLLKSRNDIDLEIFKYDNILEHYATENIILEQLLNCDEELRQAYNAKEEYLIFDQVTQKEINNCNNKRMELTSLIKRFRHTQVEESIKVAETLNNWKEEILNSFIWINNRRISNGPVEGKNNYIKKILSNANGMVNFKRARNRILYSQNKYETYSTKEHKDKIKRPSNPRGTYKKNKK